MLTDNDLPEDWEVFESPHPNGKDIEMLLQVRPSGGERDQVFSWDEIRHVSTGTRVLLRMAPPRVEDGMIVENGARVTGVIVLPSETGGRVTAKDMRFPLGHIEGASNIRNELGFSLIKSALAAGDYKVPEPVGKPDGTDSFYGRVALLWVHFLEDPNPTEQVRKVNNVSLPTAQRWVTEARKRNMLPPGRRGRAK